MALILADTLPLIEPVPIDDELCSGLALIEDVSGIAARFRYSIIRRRSTRPAPPRLW